MQAIIKLMDVVLKMIRINYLDTNKAKLLAISLRSSDTCLVALPLPLIEKMQAVSVPITLLINSQN